MKPPEKYLTDESSGIQYINPLWEQWQNDTKQIADAFADALEYGGKDGVIKLIEQLRKEVNK